MDERIETAQSVWARLKAATDVDYAMEHVMRPAPVPTGVVPLDRELGGGVPVGTYAVIAGEGGCGKSALACVMAYEAASSGRPAVFFSMEMPAEQVVGRMLSIHTTKRRDEERARGVPEDMMTRQVWWSSTHKVVQRMAGHAIDSEREAEAYIAEHGPFDSVLAAWEDFRASVWQLVSVPDSVATISDACEIVDALCSVGVRPLVVVDYLQLGADGEGDGSEYERVTRGSGMLAQLAKRWKIPVVVVSSLRNVGREERKDAPRLSMLRSSGRIGFDAGTVIVLRRAGERDGAVQPVEAHVIKNRVGRSGGCVTLDFNGGLNLFSPRSQQP